MEQFHGTTILSVRRHNGSAVEVALGGDGQVTLGNIVVKGSARKVRKLHHDRVLFLARDGVERRRAVEQLVDAQERHRAVVEREHFLPVRPAHDVRLLHRHGSWCC